MLSGNKTEKILYDIYYPALVQSGNRYAYCMNSPLRYVDPLGLKEDTIDNIISKIDELEQVAMDYIGSDSPTTEVMHLVLSFVRRNRYSDENWDGIAGEINYLFVDSVKENYKDLYDYFTVTDTDPDFFVTGVSPEIDGGKIDLWHLFATAQAQVYNSGFKDGVKQGLMFEGELDNLAGWAGDLQTLIVHNFKTERENGASYNDVYQKTTEYITNTDANSSFFSYVDLISDVDAFNIGQILKNNPSVFGAFEKYYEDGYETRYTEFANNMPNWEIRFTARHYTLLRFCGIIKWPLMNTINSIPTNVTKGVAHAFADYIIKQRNNERRS